MMRGPGEHGRWGENEGGNPTQVPTQKPPQTDPNQAEPCKGSETLLARRPYVARSSNDLISEIKRKIKTPNADLYKS